MIFWRRKTREAELDEELRAHLSMAAQTRMERGVDPEEAERAARREFENVGLVKEVTRDAWGGRWLGDLLDDARYGLRTLGKNPGFTAVAMLTLALGIGSNTAVFSLIDALLLRSLAVPAPRELVHISFGPPGTKGEARLDLYRRMLEALRHAPGVEAASVIAVRPLGEGGMDESAAPVEGNGPETKHLFKNVVGPEYFATAGTKVLAGREFSQFDRFGRTPVCILNQAAASFFFPRQNALGKHVRSTERDAKGDSCEVLAVVADAKYLSLREPASPSIYYPYEQVPNSNWGGFITRSHDTSAAVAAFKKALSRFAPDTPLLPPITMQRQLEDSIGKERLTAALSLFFGGLALLLTSIGLYGLESQRVARRTAEIGLRMALGAQTKDMLWFVLREAAVIFAIGVPIGLALTFAASHFIGAQLYEISPLDPRIYFVAVMTLLGAGFLASSIPARRAMNVDPMVALRYE
jgi:predicted permease